MTEKNLGMKPLKVEQVENMVLHAGRSFFGLGMDLEGRIWSLGPRGVGELVRE